MKNEPLKDKGTELLITLAIFPIAIFFNLYADMRVWHYTMVPLGMKELTMLQAFGVGLFLSSTVGTAVYRSENNSRPLYTPMIYGIVLHGFNWLLAYSIFG